MSRFIYIYKCILLLKPQFALLTFYIKTAAKKWIRNHDYPSTYGLQPITFQYKYFLDFRSYQDEYKNESGLKLLDNCKSKQSLYVMDTLTMERKKLAHFVWLNQVGILQEIPELFIDDSNTSVKHYFVSLIGPDFAVKWITDKELPLLKRIWGITLLLLFLLCRLPYFYNHIKKDIDDGGLFRLYKSTIDFSGMAIRSALRLIAAKGAPFVICCHAGKDRTGIMSAILLSICGYDKDVIASDYEMTEIGINSTHAELQQYKYEMRRAPKEVMYELLSYIDERYGSMQDYLISIGFSKQEQTELRKILCPDFK